MSALDPTGCRETARPFRAPVFLRRRARPLINHPARTCAARLPEFGPKGSLALPPLTASKTLGHSYAAAWGRHGAATHHRRRARRVEHIE